MTKFRTILLATLGAVILLSLSSAIANAQQFPSDVVNRYSNKPCSNAYISWALWSRSEGFSPGSSGTSADCNPNNYGSWRTAAQLLARLDTYHFEKKMNANGISLLGGFQGKNGDGYLVFKKGTAMLGMNIGRILVNGGGSLINQDGAGVVAQGAGNLVDMKVIIDQGGAKILGNSSSGVVAQGAGNVVAQGAGNAQRRVLAAGDTLFQFPNRYAVVSGRKY